jgi:hypothetical protein
MDELAAGDARSHLAEVALKGLDPHALDGPAARGPDRIQVSELARRSTRSKRGTQYPTRSSADDLGASTSDVARRDQQDLAEADPVPPRPRRLAVGSA